jgi:hypothetical protein
MIPNRLGIMQQAKNRFSIPSPHHPRVEVALICRTRL